MRIPISPSTLLYIYTYIKIIIKSRFCILNKMDLLQFPLTIWGFCFEALVWIKWNCSKNWWLKLISALYKLNKTHPLLQCPWPWACVNLWCLIWTIKTLSRLHQAGAVVWWMGANWKSHHHHSRTQWEYSGSDPQHYKIINQHDIIKLNITVIHFFLGYGLSVPGSKIKWIKYFIWLKVHGSWMLDKCIL